MEKGFMDVVNSWLDGNFDEATKAGLDEEGINQAMEQNRKDLNMQIPSYEHLAEIEIVAQEFEKTPKKSIKRYLYK